MDKKQKSCDKRAKVAQSVQKFISHFDEQENLSKPKANMSFHKINKNSFC